MQPEERLNIPLCLDSRTRFPADYAHGFRNVRNTWPVGKDDDTRREKRLYGERIVLKAADWPE